jgi:ribose/xylose/arabinose/galactoside ABC-type transport system permease subunit
MSSLPEAGVSASAAEAGPPLMTAAELRSIGMRYRLRQSALFVAIIFAVTQVVCIAYGAANSGGFAYLSKSNVTTAFQQVPLVGIATLGVGILMIAGEFDLSIGANAIFTSIITAQIFNGGTSIWLAALAGLAVGAGIGLLNGVLTMTLRIPSFITTLGTLGIWTAATLLVHGSAAETFTPTGAFRALTAGQIGWIPAEALWFIALGVVFWVILQRTSIGNHMFAAGGSQTAAIASGVNVTKAKLFAFTVTGLLAAMSGLLGASRIGSISPGDVTTLPLQAIAAAVIGGVILTGGTGTILGMMIGATLIYWIQDVLLLLAAPGYYLTAFVGALTIVAAWSYAMFRRRIT